MSVFSPSVYLEDLEIFWRTKCQNLYELIKCCRIVSFPTGGGLIHNDELKINFDTIISVENLLLAWRDFKSGKEKKKDVQEFSFRLMDNILALHAELENGTYRHGGYHYFRISDPKPRDIHKASVRDRLVHHAIYRILYPYFDKTFIVDSYSCRIDKGTHKALNRFRDFGYKVSRNNTSTCWVLKCDIKKFFANIDHSILINILRRHISDERVLNLLVVVISSFHSNTPSFCMYDASYIHGLPLGNLTSQLLVNIYMNEFDQFVKHKLKAKYYIRYADDFVFMSQSKAELEVWLLSVSIFLKERLRLELHPDKVFIKTFPSGVDFLGWVHFPDHRVLRTAAKKRMIRNLQMSASDAQVASYRGMLSHGNAQKLRKAIDDILII